MMQRVLRVNKFKNVDKYCCSGCGRPTAEFELMIGDPTANALLCDECVEVLLNELFYSDTECKRERVVKRTNMTELPCSCWECTDALCNLPVTDDGRYKEAYRNIRHEQCKLEEYGVKE